ncbi:hypothetical protein [Miltoncostaea oceani]|uniref:hypothetical protein n=1 Tax=Miltoncostaea oceani TaxID=2843216 RepID=UPI001C3DC245|nr:hypothetical protein [Miltoncostaea oceani]
MPTATSRRTQYTEDQKAIVRAKYPQCRTVADKERLAEEVGVTSVHKLYNLASRLGVTRSNDEWARRPDEIIEAAANDPILSPKRLAARDPFFETSFDADSDDFLRRNFGRQTIEKIAFHLDKTVSAMLYRARHLGLRKPNKYWEGDQVSAWLCLDEEDWTALADQGLVRHQLTDRNGRVKMSVIATIAIARWLVRGNRWQRLVAERGADEFFCREIIESVADLQQRQTSWEPCSHLSASHTCQNSYAATSFSLFCADNDRYMAGCDPKCGVRQLRPEDLRPES